MWLHSVQLFCSSEKAITCFFVSKEQDDDAEDVDNDDQEEGSSSVSLASMTRLHRWLSGSGKGGAAASSGALAGTGMSVRDLELVLCHNLEELTDWADRRRQLTKADLLLLKVVLAAGLYPQIAVPDPANAYRVANKGGAAGPGAEMIFHTPVGLFSLLCSQDPSKCRARKYHMICYASKEFIHTYVNENSIVEPTYQCVCKRLTKACRSRSHF